MATTKTDNSLVDRVSCAIDRSICPDQWLHQDAAKAAIREVAAWLREEDKKHGGARIYGVAALELEQEVKQ